MLYPPDLAAHALQQLIHMVTRHTNLTFTADDYGWHDYVNGWQQTGFCQRTNPHGQWYPCPLCCERHKLQSQSQSTYLLHCVNCGLQIVESPEIWRSNLQTCKSALTSLLQLNSMPATLQDKWLGALDTVYGKLIVHLVNAATSQSATRKPAGVHAILFLGLEDNVPEGIQLCPLFELLDFSGDHIRLNGLAMQHAIETSFLGTAKPEIREHMVEEKVRCLLNSGEITQHQQAMAYMEQFGIRRDSQREIWERLRPANSIRGGVKKKSAK